LRSCGSYLLHEVSPNNNWSTIIPNSNCRLNIRAVTIRIILVYISGSTIKSSFFPLRSEGSTIPRLQTMIAERTTMPVMIPSNNQAPKTIQTKHQATVTISPPMAHLKTSGCDAENVGRTFVLVKLNITNVKFQRSNEWPSILQ
jgi:hypothetical protein